MMVAGREEGCHSSGRSLRTLDGVLLSSSLDQVPQPGVFWKPSLKANSFPKETPRGKNSLFSRDNSFPEDNSTPRRNREESATSRERLASRNARGESGPKPSSDSILNAETFRDVISPYLLNHPELCENIKRYVRSVKVLPQHCRS